MSRKPHSNPLINLNPIWTRVLKLPIWTRGQNCPIPLKSLKCTYFDETYPKWVININSWNESKKLFSSSMTSPWRNYDVIIMWFSIFLGQNLKTLYLWNNASYRIRSFIVRKHLPSSKRWLIIRMDISAPDREISELNSNKIPEKSEFFVGGPKISIFENWLIFYIRIMKMSNLVKFHQNICIFEDFTAIYIFCVFIRIWPEIIIFSLTR